MLELSPDQNKTLKILVDFCESKNRKEDFITLGGFAGTGKTTLISGRSVIPRGATHDKVPPRGFPSDGHQLG